MTFREYVERETKAGRLPIVEVRHPVYGALTMPAYSARGAKVQAALIWNVREDEMEHMRVGIRSNENAG